MFILTELYLFNLVVFFFFFFFFFIATSAAYGGSHAGGLTGIVAVV